MQTKNEIINNILIDYEILQKKREEEERKYKEQIYNSFPELREIDDKLRLESVNMCRNAISGVKNNNKEKIAYLLDKKSEIFRENNIKNKEEYVKYSCHICKDTGVIEEETGKISYCSCFKNKFIQMAFKNSNLAENFRNVSLENFDVNIFDNIEKYDGLTQRDNIIGIRNVIINYSHNFEDERTKSLIFYGKTGTGKTYMSVTLAKELIKMGYQALYTGVNELVDKLSNYYFSTDKLNNPDKLYVDFVYDTDFLVIDDLGQELTNTFVISRIGDIINSRIIKNKKTLISTNLEPGGLSEIYNARIYSRLEENYEFYNFIGRDLRQS